jgi:cytochrome b561
LPCSLVQHIAVVRSGDALVKYSLAQIALHWIVALMVLAQWITSYAIHRTHNTMLPPARSDLLQHSWHNYAGMAVGALVGFYVLLRLVQRMPPLGKTWLDRGAAYAHWLIYGLILAQSATGFIAAYVWGGAARFHIQIWNAVLALIILHVLAALYHAARRDGVLGRMLPRFRSH